MNKVSWKEVEQALEDEKPIEENASLDDLCEEYSEWMYQKQCKEVEDDYYDDDSEDDYYEDDSYEDDSEDYDDYDDYDDESYDE